MLNITAKTDNLSLLEVFSLLLNYESCEEQVTAARTLETDGNINANFFRVSFNKRKPVVRGFEPGNFRGATYGKGKGINNFG